MTTHTEKEILSQPEVWQQTLDALDPLSFVSAFDGITDVLVTGCGSTHYLAMTAAALLRDAGRRAWALPASELLEQAQPRLVDPQRTLLLAISRSGTTTETVRAVEHFRRLGGARVATVTCYPDSALADASDVVWAAPAAAEQSVAQTRSFTSMQVIASAVAGALRGADLGVLDTLPSAAAGILTHSRDAMAALAARLLDRGVLLPRLRTALRHRVRGHAQAQGDVAHGVRGLPLHGVPARAHVDVRRLGRRHRAALTRAGTARAGGARPTSRRSGRTW